jgi:hypothetical protein
MLPLKLSRASDRWVIGSYDAYSTLGARNPPGEIAQQAHFGYAGVTFWPLLPNYLREEKFLPEKVLKETNFYLDEILFLQHFRKKMCNFFPSFAILS